MSQCGKTVTKPRSSVFCKLSRPNLALSRHLWRLSWQFCWSPLLHGENVTLSKDKHKLQLGNQKVILNHLAGFLIFQVPFLQNVVFIFNLCRNCWKCSLAHVFTQSVPATSHWVAFGVGSPRSFEIWKRNGGIGRRTKTTAAWEI